jgi:hypothetical protein
MRGLSCHEIRNIGRKGSNCVPGVAQRARAADSFTVVLETVWSTKCSVVNAERNAAFGSFSSIVTLLPISSSRSPEGLDPMRVVLLGDTDCRVGEEQGDPSIDEGPCNAGT